MKPLAWNELKGNWAPVLIPYQDNEQIDYTRLREEIAVLIEFGVNGIYTNGTSSEFYNQTEEEFDRISQITAEYCNNANEPFQIGISHSNPWITLQRMRRIKPLQPSAVQIILPDWFALNDDEILDYFRRIAEAADPIGIVLYNPSFAKRVLQPCEWKRIRDVIPNFIGVKVSIGDATWHEQVRSCANEIAVFTPGHFLATSIQNGAQGAYSNAACLHPGAAQKWYEQMLTDMPAALELEARIQSFMKKYIAPYITQQRYSHQAADRLLAMIGGWCDIGPRLRWPYQWISTKEAERLQPAAKEILPEFFA